MTDTKLSVTITRPGGVMMTPQECGENPENYNKVRILLSVRTFDKKTKKFFYKKEPLEFRTRRCATAQQVIKMSNEAYDYMTSSMCPDWFIPMGGISKWKSLSKEKRLEHHLDRLCSSLRGISYTYVIFGD